MRKLAMTIVLLCLSMCVSAGSLRVDDVDHKLGERTKLETFATTAPFDVKVIIGDGRVAPGAAYDAWIASQTRDNEVTIGIDLANRHTTVHAGANIPISSTALGTLAVQANPDFRSKDFEGGVVRILSGVKQHLAVVAQQPRQASGAQEGAASSGKDILIVLGLALFGAAIVIFVVSRAHSARAERERRDSDAQRRYQVFETPIREAAFRRDPLVSKPTTLEYTPPSAAYPKQVYHPPAVVVNSQPAGLTGSPILDYMVADSLLHNHSAPAAQSGGGGSSYSHHDSHHDSGGSSSFSSSIDWGGSAGGASGSSDW